MLRIALAAALLAAPSAAFAQAGPAPAAPAAAAPGSSAGRTNPSIRPGQPGGTTNAKPQHHGSHGNRPNHGSNSAYTPAVIINANDYIATPNPHKTPFRNTTHNTIPPGQEIFSSQSTK
jgi:hypothetical protein